MSGVTTKPPSSKEMPVEVIRACSDVSRILTVHSDGSVESWKSILLTVGKLDLLARKHLALAELRVEVKTCLDAEVPGRPRPFHPRVARATQAAMRRGATADECEEVISSVRRGRSNERS